MVDLTAIILTKNEEANIEACIRSIQQFAKRIVVVDSGSTDRTADIAKSYGADVYVHPFENYARQFNWGIENTNIHTKWILRLDADERFTPALCEELCSGSLAVLYGQMPEIRRQPQEKADGVQDRERVH